MMFISKNWKPMIPGGYNFSCFTKFKCFTNSGLMEKACGMGASVEGARIRTCKHYKFNVCMWRTFHDSFVQRYNALI